MPEIEPNTCPVCEGNGFADNAFCTNCMGSGAVPVVGLNRYLKEQFSDITDKLADISEKVDEIKTVVDAL